MGNLQVFSLLRVTSVLLYNGSMQSAGKVLTTTCITPINRKKEAVMSGNEAKPRPKTGNWRPFRPAGMSDGAWMTMVLIHRYPEEWMSEEEQRHCLGPKDPF